MKWNRLIALRVSELITNQIFNSDLIKLKGEKEFIRKKIEMKIMENFEQEKALIQEVYNIIEDLEKQGHDFERQKMFPILKSRLAKKKGFVL